MFPAYLDPERETESERCAVLAWLRVQQAYALRPMEAAARLAKDPRPEPLLEGVEEKRDPELARAALVRAPGWLVPWPARAYPERLRRIADAAPVLAVRGDPEVLTRPCVAIVGARAATAYGREMAARLAAGLAEAGVVVVSGLARGIDAAAHEAALAAGGKSIAVQACGIDQVYPAAHRKLAARIAASGAVVSELPPGMPPLPAHFPLRNRLISGMSRAVVVVEARIRSGSLVTSRHAADQGIEVLAVPGPATAPTSEGTNDLLRQGATPAIDAGDVLCAAGLSERTEPTRRARRPEHEGPVIAALYEAPCARDALARRLGWEPGRLAVELVELELSGRIVEERDGTLRVTGEA